MGRVGTLNGPRKTEYAKSPGETRKGDWDVWGGEMDGVGLGFGGPNTKRGHRAGYAKPPTSSVKGEERGSMGATEAM